MGTGSVRRHRAPGQRHMHSLPSIPHTIIQVIFINCAFIFMLLFFYLSIISNIFSLLCWEGPVSNHFTVHIHLWFTKHVTNNILFDLIPPSGAHKRESHRNKMASAPLLQRNPENYNPELFLEFYCTAISVISVCPGHL